MSKVWDCSGPGELGPAVAAAAQAVAAGELVVLPTDTLYGVGADAFVPWAVERLRAARGQQRGAPLSVLVGTVRAAAALIDDMGTFGQDLIDQFWPGGLTLVCRASPTLAWDLGDTRGTVAVRMPLHAVALDLLKRTGPMAVSSANITGNPAATTADEALEQLGDSVAVYLDGGPCPGGVASTIIDLTGSVPRLLRAGAIPMDRLRAVAALVTGEDVPASASVNGAAGLPGVPGVPGPAEVPGLPNGPAQAPAPDPARNPAETTAPAAADSVAEVADTSTPAHTDTPVDAKAPADERGPLDGAEAAGAKDAADAKDAAGR
jgi:L-threonylcarbamoyladenylate synthase